MMSKMIVVLVCMASGLHRTTATDCLQCIDDIKATVTARGCFAVDTNIKEGCYTEKNMLNDQKIGKKFGKGIALFQIQIGDIHNGKLCINGSSTLCYTPVVLLLLILKLKLTEILIE
ncbi:unnamed protein product [Mytilus coruscus]|uniref:Uncharacterized protein n=1 Tax=Mytilus coruscus TaxID=42192 RepID=A0A6J8C5R7_MYTCO|nr:unnamed protein product [Mytilus coruscus]